MKKGILILILFVFYLNLYAQTQIDSSDIWYSGNNTVIGNSGTFIEPYSGFNSQNNQGLQLRGKSTNYGIPTFSFVKSYHGNDYGGSLTWVSDNFQSSDKRFAQVGADVSNGKGTLNFHTRNETDPSGQFNTMTMDNNGNLGLGTSAPGSKFELFSNQAYFNAAHANAFVIRTSNSPSSNDSRMLGLTIMLDDDNSVHHQYQKSVGIFAQSSGAWSNNVDMLFYTRGTDQAPYFTEKMRIRSNGNIGIGTSNPESKLAVNGQIRATEVKVLADINVPDYVFEPNYELRTLKDTKKYITENKHLPEIPSTREINENGIDLGDMNMRLLKKIEELTLYQIELLEKLEQQNERLQHVETELQTLRE